MRQYLAWEVDLAKQIARDSDCRFRLAPVTGLRYSLIVELCIKIVIPGGGSPAPGLR